jgi:hypothetical protein
MSRYALICPSCQAEVSLSARRLLVRIDDGTATSGEVLFICLVCNATVTVPLEPSAVAVLVLGGVTHLSLSAPAPEHPEPAPGGPAFTHDDLIDLHRDLGGDSWFDQLVGGVAELPD